MQIECIKRVDGEQRESRVRAEREQKENRERREKAERERREKAEREREKKERAERVDLPLLIISPSDDDNDVSLAHHNYDIVIRIDVMS